MLHDSYIHVALFVPVCFSPHLSHPVRVCEVSINREEGWERVLHNEIGKNKRDLPVKLKFILDFISNLVPSTMRD